MVSDVGLLCVERSMLNHRICAKGIIYRFPATFMGIHTVPVKSVRDWASVRPENGAQRI